MNLRKKLKKYKGFTLIELMAIIVILAILLVTVVPAIYESIGSSKKESLQSEAISLATWASKTILSDSLLIEHNVDPSEIPEVGKWKCIKKDGGIGKQLSDKDYELDKTTLPGGTDYLNPSVNSDTCSAIYRVSIEEYEAVLIAKKGGKLFLLNATKDDVMYATSFKKTSWQE